VHSGIAELLRERLGPDADPFVAAIDNELEADATAWAQRLELILLDQAAADRRAADLYARLRESLRWSAAARDLLTAMVVGGEPA
jgi:hypothetical protein